ncbi:MAG TPA: hypothetical protein VH950_11055 [Gaiellaceae bacterium]|jgi:hypothetical protein
MTSTSPLIDAPLGRESPPAGFERWEYLVVPLQEAKGLKKADEPWTPDRLNQLGEQGWEAIGLSLKYGDLIAWPVVLLKRPLA